VFICGFLFHFMSVAAGDSQALDSAEFIELRDGLANSRYVFEQEGDVRVAFLGGSITQMTGWRDLVCEELQVRFPDTDFDFVQAGIASMGSTPGAFRLARDVLSHGRVDLLFVEAAVNDATNYRTSVEHIRGMEGIVRHARTVNPAIDIVHLHFVDPDKMEAYRAGKRPEVIANHERVADYYGNPSIDLAREVTERIDAGEFTWEDDFKNLHPSPFGHRVYLRSIQRLFDLAWSGPVPNGVEAHPIPDAPLDAYSYTHGRIVSINSAESLHGFHIVANWKPSDGAGTRPGFTEVPMLAGTEPGSSFTFAFTGTAVGLWVAAGPDAGVVEYSIDGAPFTRIDLYTEWSSGLHLPWAYILDGALADGPHTVEVRIAKPSANRENGGTSVRIAHFLVNG
jgi:lysophospholipase L1-like esterase